MLKKIVVGLSLLSCIAGSEVYAQKITSPKTECLFAYTFPYVLRDHGGPPLSRALTIVALQEELFNLGVIKWFEIEVSGNKAFTCLVADRMTRDKWIPIKELIITKGRGILVSSDQHIKDMFSYEIYTPYLDEVTGQVEIADGVDGRELRTAPAPGIQAYERLLQTVRTWRSKCGAELYKPECQNMVNP